MLIDDSDAQKLSSKESAMMHAGNATDEDFWRRVFDVEGL
jgi:hypothetical protein